MQGKADGCAALQPHLAGTELIVFGEPHEAADFLETRISGLDSDLEQRAEVLEELLREKGWEPLRAES
jgi:hypothetical protein